jgi:hypothetical protein
MTVRYALSRWEGLTRFIDDGRIELDRRLADQGFIRVSALIVRHIAEPDAQAAAKQSK